MKINQGMRVSQDPVKTNVAHKNSDQLSFQDMLKQQNTRMTVEQMSRLLSEIETQGQRLNRLRTARELKSYKKLIQRFMQEAVQHGVDLEDQTSLTARGRERKLKLLRQLDEKLMALTDEVLQHEGASIDLLDRIGEIKGLLVNLYF